MRGTLPHPWQPQESTWLSRVIPLVLDWIRTQKTDDQQWSAVSRSCRLADSVTPESVAESAADISDTPDQITAIELIVPMVQSWSADDAGAWHTVDHAVILTCGPTTDCIAISITDDPR